MVSNVFIFLHLSGKMIQFDSYFSKGSKPPARLARAVFGGEGVFKIGEYRMGGIL